MLDNPPISPLSIDTPRRLRRKSKEMRLRFIDVTTRLVRDKGISAVSTRDICDAVGVKAPTLYHHFGDVAKLHSAVIDAAFTNYYAYWKDRSNTGDPYQRVRDGWDSYISFSQAEPELYAIVAQQNFNSDLPAPILQAHFDLVQDLKTIQSIRALRYDPELTAQIFTAACIGVASMLAAQQRGIPMAPDLSAVAREAVLSSLLI